jgi:N-acetylmuramoyl-L-alanine amidase
MLMTITRQRPQTWAVIGVLLLLTAGEALAKGTCPRAILVAVDAGHHAAAPGATSARGKTEYAFNRRFARELVVASHDWPGLHLELIATPQGKGRGLAERAEFAAREGADVLLSIHHDAANEKYLRRWTHGGVARDYADDFSGYSLFVSRDGRRFPASLALARLIGETLRAKGQTPTLHHAEKLPNESRELLEPKLGIYEAPFVILASSKVPAVLFEAGVILNRDEELRLEDPVHRALLQEALLEALDAWCVSRPR